jgi:hypothetical protein
LKSHSLGHIGTPRFFPNKKKQRPKTWFVIFALSVVIITGLLLVRRHFESQNHTSFETARIERGPIQAFGVPGLFVPILMRETGQKGAEDGEGQEAYSMKGSGCWRNGGEFTTTPSDTLFAGL